MYESDQNSYLRLPDEVQTALIAAARNGTPVRGLTHGFYKYPARFSPIFAGAAINAFTQRGDLVLDPHVGGGTTLVEAIAAGREAVGVDISTLAEFVSSVKCTVLSEAELKKLELWSALASEAIDMRKPSTPFSDYERLGYYKHLDHPSRWRFRKAIEQSIASAIQRTHPTSTVLPDEERSAKRVTLSLALRSSGDAGRGVGRVGAAAPVVAG